MSEEIETEIIAEPDEESFSIFSTIVNGVILLQENAWYILAVALLCYYIWTKKLSAIYESWCQTKAIQQESAEMKKDPEKFTALESARLAAIQRLQEKYNQEAVDYTEKQKQKEEKKREEWLAKQTVDCGKKLNQGEDYSPLSGGGGTSYRAPRRSACPGSNCGNR